jgi:hypothetical protein
MCKAIFTHGWKNNDVLGIALGTVDFFQGIPFLFLINPALETAIVNPSGGSSTFAGLNPLGSVIIFISGETDPAISP